MVAAGEPERDIALHAVIADQNILDGKQRVSHVHGIIGIGKGEENGEGVSLARRPLARLKIAALFPHLVNFFFKFI